MVSKKSLIQSSRTCLGFDTQYNRILKQVQDDPILKEFDFLDTFS